MKRLFVVVLISFLLFNLNGCKSPSIESGFPFLPEYENMKQVDFQKAATPDELDRGIYTLKNITQEEFLVEYEKILHDEGWVTTLDNKPFTINLEKDDHRVMIAVKPDEIQEKKDEIEVIIYAK